MARIAGGGGSAGRAGAAMAGAGRQARQLSVQKGGQRHGKNPAEYWDDGGVRLGAAPTGVQPKDLLYPMWGRIVYIPGIPSPVRSVMGFSPDWWKATLVPALLRQPYQAPIAYAAAPAVPYSRGVKPMTRVARPFGNDTNEYMNAKAPRPTWNGLAPSQRVLPTLGRIVRGVPGAMDTQQ